MRMIDADALAEKLVFHGVVPRSKGVDIGQFQSMFGVPVNDVVTCKECKCAYEVSSFKDGYLILCLYNGQLWNPNGYCSFGKRR